MGVRRGPPGTFLPAGRSAGAARGARRGGEPKPPASPEDHAPAPISPSPPPISPGTPGHPRRTGETGAASRRPPGGSRKPIRAASRRGGGPLARLCNAQIVRSLAALGPPGPLRRSFRDFLPSFTSVSVRSCGAQPADEDEGALERHGGMGQAARASAEDRDGAGGQRERLQRGGAAHQREARARRGGAAARGNAFGGGDAFGAHRA